VMNGSGTTTTAAAASAGVVGGSSVGGSVGVDKGPGLVKSAGRGTGNGLGAFTNGSAWYLLTADYWIGVVKEEKRKILRETSSKLIAAFV
jgi:hypothetical protein